MNFKDWNERMFKKHGAFERRYIKSGSRLLKHIEFQRIKTILKLLNYKSSDIILDVGCGDGTLIKKINGKRILGIDISETAVKTARKNLQHKKNVLIKRIDAEEMTLPSDSFDRVVCTEVLEHTLKPENVVKEILRVIKKDGYAVITVPNEKTVKKIKAVLKKLKLLKILAGNISGNCSEEWHIHLFDKKLFKKIVRNKFKIDRVEAIPNHLVPIWLVFKCKPIK